MDRKTYQRLRPVQQDLADSGAVGQALGQFSGAACALAGCMTVNLGRALWAAAFPPRKGDQRGQ